MKINMVHFSQQRGVYHMKGNLWMEIRSEKKKGLSYAEIGRKHHIDPRTAKICRD